MRLRIVLGAIFGCVAVAAVAGAATASTVAVQWDTLAGAGAYTQAGQLSSDFALSNVGSGGWQLLSTGGAPELGFMKTAGTPSGDVEVHLDSLVNGAYARVGDYTSDFTNANAAVGSFQLFGSSGGAPELGFIKTAGTPSGDVEVHWDTLVNGSYRRAGDYTSDFAVANAPDGTFQLLPNPSSTTPELGFIKTAATGSGTIEVHLDQLASGRYVRVLDATSDFGAADGANGAWQLVPTTGAPLLGFVKLRSTAGTIEVHWDTLSSTSYVRAGDHTSDFSPADAGDGTWQLIPGAGAAPILGLVRTSSALPATTPPPAPITSTGSPGPVTTVVPVSSAPHHVRVRVQLRWSWRGRSTRLRRVRFGALPAAVQLSFVCRGRDCPRPGVWTADRHRAGRLARTLRGARFRAGDRILITITAPGLLPERARVLIRRDALPRVQLL
ncbi:MAG TPA: hypothetical protein VG223_18385 [Solirubrobacteraceae bacterium]|jgi:hypothetical protein|nr:hypothetical protein [Solirubrobacteraceae bacterium]